MGGKTVWRGCALAAGPGTYFWHSRLQYWARLHLLQRLSFTPVSGFSSTPQQSHTDHLKDASAPPPPSAIQRGRIQRALATPAHAAAAEPSVRQLHSRARPPRAGGGLKLARLTRVSLSAGRARDAVDSSCTEFPTGRAAARPTAPPRPATTVPGLRPPRPRLFRARTHEPAEAGRAARQAYTT